jgi:hypothetical protein
VVVEMVLQPEWERLDQPIPAAVAVAGLFMLRYLQAAQAAQAS